MRHPNEIQLLDLVEGEGDAKVQAHVDGCASCAKDVAALAQAKVALQGAPALAVSEEAETRIRQTLASLPAQQPKSRLSWPTLPRLLPRLALIAPTAAVAAAALVVAFLPQTPASSPQERASGGAQSAESAPRESGEQGATTSTKDSKQDAQTLSESAKKDKQDEQDKAGGEAAATPKATETPNAPAEDKAGAVGDVLLIGLPAAFGLTGLLYLLFRRRRLLEK